MGACDFEDRVEKRGRDAQAAFLDAVAQAEYENGHGGYTGTIAEKHEFQMMTPPAGMTPDDYVAGLRSDWCEQHPKFPGFNPFLDKWGPAGCIDDGDYWVFIGSASS